jgi:uncharacterized Fe-S cluster protein YjdI
MRWPVRRFILHPWPIAEGTTSSASTYKGENRIMDTHTKPWIQPELTILVRNKPEEAVLTACKETIAAPSSGPLSFDVGCNISFIPGLCDPCSDKADS